MKILILQNHVMILHAKQLLHIKGGNDGGNSTDIIVITDDDII